VYGWQADGVTLDLVHDPHPDGTFLSGPPLWAAFYSPSSSAAAAAGSSPAPADSEALARQLDSVGFDLCTSFRSSWYNDLIRSLGLATDEDHVGGTAFKLISLPDFGRGGDALAVLIGNSKAMWPIFLRWLCKQPNPDQIEDPVDDFADEAIRSAVASFAGSTKYDIFWAADYSPERLVDMNRVSLVSGMCYFSEEMFLSVHPTFGSWVAFRAVVVFDLPATHLGEAAPERLPSLLTAEEEAAARVAFAEAMRASSEVEMTPKGMPLHIAYKWAALRDCVGVGREHKYSNLQSEYHYTKDPDFLLRALKEEVHQV